MNRVHSWAHTFFVINTQTLTGAEQFIANVHVAEQISASRQKLQQSKGPASTPASENSLCAFTQLAWIPTTQGLKTVRETYEQAHLIEGFDEDLTGVEQSSLTRLFASLTALLLRDGRKLREATGQFAAADIDRLQELVAPHMDLFHPEVPFLQRPATLRAPNASKWSKPASLYPWAQTDEVGLFFDRIEPEPEFSLPRAVLALSCFMTHSLPSNKAMSDHDGEGYTNYGQFSGSPGWQHPGGEYGAAAVEIMFTGETLFETLLRTTPLNWVTGGGLPAWMDWGANKTMKTRSKLPPLWHETWFPNQAFCIWNEDRTKLVGVITGGGVHLPPDSFFEMQSGRGKNRVTTPVPVPQQPPWDFNLLDKAAKKEWSLALAHFWSTRKHHDPFYLWSMVDPNTQKKGAEVKYRAYRPRLTGSIKETLAGWYRDKAMDVLYDNKRRFVVDPDQYDYVTFMSHTVGGQSASPQIRSSMVYTDKMSVWFPKELPAPFAAAANTIGAVVNDLENIWLERDANGKPVFGKLDPSTANQKNRTVKLFWMKISDQLPQFLDDPQATSTPEFWQKVRTIAFASYDQATMAYARSAGIHRTESRRARLSLSLHSTLEKHL